MRPSKVVVIGGGIAGVSITRELARAGVAVSLLEKSNMLCSGATWHAAGLVTRFAGSAKLKKIHVRSLQLLNEIEKEFGIGLHTPGSIRLIEKGNEDRLREAENHVSMARLFDYPSFRTELISADRIEQLHPLLNVSSIECGVYTPADGDVDPTSLTNAVAKQARAAGANIKLNSPVVSVDAKPGGGYLVNLCESVGGERLECDAVVNAAGLWSRNISAMAPLSTDGNSLCHPAFVIEHQYAVTEAIREVKDLSDAGHNGGRLPVLRDLEGSSYIRQEGDGFLIGPYENECVVRTDMPNGPPSSFAMELFAPNLDRIEYNLIKGMDLVPCLVDAGFKSIVNGPTIWTGDSLARCGRSELPGWYDFNSLTYGIAQSLPLAEYLAYIMLEGEQPPGFDCSDYFDPLRYGTWANNDFTVAKIKETYSRNNCIVFTYENRSAGREFMAVGSEKSNASTSQYPLHSVFAKHGARFAPFGGSGCEVPLCFVTDDDNATIDFHDTKRFSNFEWVPYAEAEAAHSLKSAGIAYSSFSKLEITGSDSKEFISEVTTGVLPSTKPEEAGANDFPCRLTYCCTPKGYVCSEFTLCRLDSQNNKWYLVGSRDHTRHDIAWLSQQIRNRDVTIKDKTDEVCVLHIFGPSSGKLLGGIEPRIDGLGFMRARKLKKFANLDNVSDVTIFRVSFTGEMGFELHLSSSDGPAIHAAIMNHQLAKTLSLRHVGNAAINSLRIEKGFKFRADIDLAHYCEAGIGPFVAKKRHFLGKDASIHPKRLSAMFQVRTEPRWEWSVIGDLPIHRKSDGQIVGYTTTSARGATTGSTLALGYLLTSAFDIEADEKEELEMNAYGFSWPVSIERVPPASVNREVWYTHTSKP